MARMLKRTRCEVDYASRCSDETIDAGELFKSPVSHEQDAAKYGGTF